MRAIPQPATVAELEQWHADGFFIRHAQLDGCELSTLRDVADRVARELANRADPDTKTTSKTESDVISVYHLDGNRFVDINHITLQYEHHRGSRKARVIEPVHELHAQFSALVADLRLVEPMRSLVGQHAIAVWTAKLNYKHARGGSGFGWHQDSPYWIHDSSVVDQLPNVFVALDDASASNGGLRVVRGSHTQGVLPGRDDGSQLEGFFTHPSVIDDDKVVTPELPAGSLLFFSPHLVHGSLANPSLNPRRALIATYQPAGLPELKSGQIGPTL